MRDRIPGGTTASSAPWIQKLFLTDDGSDLKIEARAPWAGPATMAVIARTDEGEQVLGSVQQDTAGGPLRLEIPRSRLPQDTRLGSTAQSLMYDPTDATRPGIYLLLGRGNQSLRSVTEAAMDRDGRATPGDLPPGTLLTLESGAELEPRGIEWPMGSMVPDEFWLVGNTGGSRLNLVVISPTAAPASNNAVFLVRRGARAVVASPTWIMPPGSPIFGVMDVSVLSTDPATTFTVRRFLTSETVSVTLSADTIADSTTVVEDFPSPIVIGGVSFDGVAAYWRDDNSLGLSPVLTPPGP